VKSSSAVSTSSAAKNDGLVGRRSADLDPTLCSGTPKSTSESISTIDTAPPLAMLAAADDRREELERAVQLISN
jgi:hypothetical protein